ncbi:50S ribosomal protein L25 [Candidatus Uhrbacteria bacterium CG_4_9_14_0_2_um_filter_41_50]|uniref:Large ribosomal subunit protein bL25 n=1 Tax=Candidatus Uhrbacteria bacterium CG_4_9_14_0_2_um_filter_41_50 TaxID=1975031 RepID=A0A2M8ENN4_9BACT|nr:MAG: 50S ribosomal protein L25 [Candidatus Uhrbacteria bacterium CG_4_10_14_3_um_filter_41_21]PIZ54242.1 MAG: 50S ribosomal protein L25 [Candidatus Uhrbacteria bacterium CG_4_10_14_0_2_um_filter_41_21]PJB84412.1 MAG: 50S ribosomal protein L25 [Candidatus Uhrbacteria bacterium CG_4_9_14_0_8_um_filter_41_16]PJC24355.1 MAG: 50S ribosomal protein L25 [Candidatus Uhrbacteria bacterium CG_4_9_14_0_2_um_filter_41_50]PJE75282.1 MAG: 50S ribosomal protein L25 [Candidatus Uhrbacteria bacterium CG10_bi
MSIISIKANVRELGGRKTDALREQGIVPAVMYGFETEPANIKMDRNEFNKLYDQAGYSSIINLEIDGATHPVLIQDMQRNPLTDFVSHVDFRRIDMSKKVETSIRIELVGESPAVKDLGGTLVQSLEEVDVSSLPSALVREFIVDISVLKTFDDAIHVSDIKVSEGMEILTDMEQTVALVQEPRSEAEMEALNKAIETPDLNPEEEKKEGEEPAEEKKDEQKG